MPWLVRLLKRRADPKQFRNYGLGLAMDWGDQWLPRIQVRLGQRYPNLDAREFDEINDECQAVMRLGHETGYAFVRDRAQTLSSESLEPVFRVLVPKTFERLEDGVVRHRPLVIALARKDVGREISKLVQATQRVQSP